LSTNWPRRSSRRSRRFCDLSTSLAVRLLWKLWPAAADAGSSSCAATGEEGYSVRAADMPGADDLMMRIYAAMPQKERELIGERTRAALGGDRGYRPATGPDSGAAALARRLAAAQAAHRLALEVERLRGEGVGTLQGLARALSGRGVPTPSGASVWTHTTVARVLARAAG
jgi:hypothetical protein